MEKIIAKFIMYTGDIHFDLSIFKFFNAKGP